MTIEYLQKLRDNPQHYSEDLSLVSEGTPTSEIATLESLFNNGNSFPKVLKELLFLAGNYCAVIDTGAYDSQQELQQETRASLQRQGMVINRPFFVIDIRAIDDPIIVYLDEGDNPRLYQVTPDREPRIREMGWRLKEFIDSGVQDIINGESPF